MSPSRTRTARRPFVPIAVLATLTIAVPVIANPSTAAATVTTAAGPGYTLVFSDDFNGTAVDTAKWNYRTDSKELSTQLPANVTVGAGSMAINLKKQQVGTVAYTGGGLITKKAFRYGYYETRAKLPAADGWHSSFWAQAGDGTTTAPANRRTEIDAVEVDSNTSGLNNQGIWAWKEADRNVSRWAPSFGFDSAAGWHTYGFDWSESAVKFYVDGQLVKTAPYSPDRGNHNDVNIWLTSIANRPVDESALPDKAQYDYVRFYQKDYYVDNDTSAAYGYSESGTWSQSTERGYTVENTSRSTKTKGATATWRPKLGENGQYDVYAYIVGTGNDPAARYDIVHQGVTTTKTVDTRVARGWISLGRYTCDPSSTQVKVTASGTGETHADAVKFVRATG
ncbi:family 16 glycosylhydrolase [Kitasatospora sp. NPDC003701]